MKPATAAWRFAALGLVCERESFEVSYFAAEIGSRLAFVGAGLLVVCGVALLTGSPAVAIPCLVLALFLANAPRRRPARCWCGAAGPPPWPRAGSAPGASG